MAAQNNKVNLHIDELKEYNNLFTVNERKELIGEMLLYLRTASGLTQSKIAELIGIKAGTYSTYENGTREIPAEILIRISILFGVPTDFILEKDRLYRDKYDVDKQVDKINEQLDELKDIMTNQKINPEAKEMLKAMTEAFENMSKKATSELKNNN